MLFKKSLKKLC